MGTVLSVVDAIVLLLLIGLVPRSVSRGLARSPWSLLLSVCVAAFVIIFAVVSFAASIAFLDNTLGQIVWLLVLLLMAYLVRISWASRPAE